MNNSTELQSGRYGFEPYFPSTCRGACPLESVYMKSNLAKVLINT